MTRHREFPVSGDRNCKRTLNHRPSSRAKLGDPSLNRRGHGLPRFARNDSRFVESHTSFAMTNRFMARSARAITMTEISGRHGGGALLHGLDNILVAGA